MAQLPAPHVVRKIAAHAGSEGVDERTVGRYLRGEPVRPVSAARIQQALAELGLPDADLDESADADEADE